MEPDDKLVHLDDSRLRPSSAPGVSLFLNHAMAVRSDLNFLAFFQDRQVANLELR